MKAHGMQGTPTYTSWRKMKERCHNPASDQFEWYGARGITVCQRWRESFAAFLADMGERPAGTTLDRWPDVDGNYEPGNCRWATKTQQARNTRTVVWVEHEGQRVRLRDFCEQHGQSFDRIYQRMEAGLSFEQAIAVKQHGRAAVALGRPAAGAKLTIDQVRHIRSSGRPLAAMAAEFNVSLGCVAKVKLRQTYRHIGDEETAGQ